MFEIPLGGKHVVWKSFLRQNPSPSSSLSHVVSLVAKGQCLGIRVAQMIKALHSGIPGKQKTAVSQQTAGFVLRRCLMKGKERNLV